MHYGRTIFLPSVRVWIANVFFHHLRDPWLTALHDNILLHFGCSALCLHFHTRYKNNGIPNFKRAVILANSWKVK